MSKTRISVLTEGSTFTLGSIPERDTDYNTGDAKSTRNGDEIWKANVVQNREGSLPQVIAVKCYRRPPTMQLGTKLAIDQLTASPWAFLGDADQVVSGVTYHCDWLVPASDLGQEEVA